MHKVERVFVYGAMVVLGWAAFARTQAVEADGAGDGRFGVLTVNEIRVNGADGTMVMKLAADEDGGYVLWRDAKGAPMGWITANAKGGYVYTMGKNGKSTAALGTSDSKGVGFLRLNDTEGERRYAVSSDEAGGYCNFTNNKGTDVAYMGSGKDMRAGLMILWDEDGKRRVEAGADTSGGYVQTQK